MGAVLFSLQNRVGNSAACRISGSRIIVNLAAGLKMNDKTTTRIEDYPYEVQERAAIYEFDAGMTRDQAEARAVEEYQKEITQ